MSGDFLDAAGFFGLNGTGGPHQSNQDNEPEDFPANFRS
jgi:hypothetical protein